MQSTYLAIVLAVTGRDLEYRDVASVYRACRTEKKSLWVQKMQQKFCKKVMVERRVVDEARWRESAEDGIFLGEAGFPHVGPRLRLRRHGCEHSHV